MGRLGDREKSKFTPSPYRPIDLPSVGVTCVTIITCTSLFVTVHAPLHIVPIYHFDRSFFHTRKTMAGGAVYSALDMNPVREDSVFWKFVHAVPWNFPICLDRLNDFQCLGSLTHRIRRMTSSTEFNVRNSCSTISFRITMTERTV
jgi:hypothetical protein